RRTPRLLIQQPDDFIRQFHQSFRILLFGSPFTEFHPRLYIFLHSPSLLVESLNDVPACLRFSISTLSSINFCGSLMILACGKNSFHDTCRLRHERHMCPVRRVGAMSSLMLLSLACPLKKGGNIQFIWRGYKEKKDSVDFPS